MQNAALWCGRPRRTVSPAVRALCKRSGRPIRSPAAMVRKGSTVRVCQRPSALQCGFRVSVAVQFMRPRPLRVQTWTPSGGEVLWHMPSVGGRAVSDGDRRSPAKGQWADWSSGRKQGPSASISGSRMKQFTAQQKLELVRVSWRDRAMGRELCREYDIVESPLRCWRDRAVEPAWSATEAAARALRRDQQSRRSTARSRRR